MKKKRLLPILLVLIAALAVMSLAACVRKKDGNGGGTGGGGGEGENPPPPPHVHTFSDEWTFNDEYHWHAATCGDTTEVKDKARHTMNGADCTVCDYHVHTFSDEWTFDNLSHWHAATCGDTTEVRDKTSHTMNGAECTVCDFAVASSESLLEFEAIGDTGYKVTGWKEDVPEEKKATLNIPAEYNSKPVVEIAENAFCLGADGEESVLHDDTLKVVVLPSSIKTIGTNAFAGNSGLTLLPELNGLASIGDFAFWDCLALTEVTVENVENIGTGVFFGCKALESVTLKDISGTIGQYIFYDCTSLKNAICDNCYSDLSSLLGKGSTYQMNSPFYNCPALENVSLLGGFTVVPKQMLVTNLSLKKIVLGKDFTGEPSKDNSWPGSLEWVDIDPKNANFVSEKGVLYNRQQDEITGITIVPSKYKGKLVIPDGVTSIANNAFSNRGFITSITIPQSVTEIGTKPFNNCYRLAEVLNFSQVALDNIATYGLPEATKVVTDKSATSKVTDPDENGYVWFDDGGKISLVAYFGNETDIDITLPESHDGKTYTVREYAFAYYENGIKSLTVTTGVTALGDYAFATSLLSEKSIEKVVLGEGITEIGQACFQWSKNLTDVSLPKSLTKLGAGAFDGCDALEEVKFAGNVNDWAAVEVGNETALDQSKITLLINGNQPIAGTVIIENVEHVGRYTFTGNDAITMVILGKGVQTVGQEAFSHCANLTKVVLGKDIGRSSDQSANRLTFQSGFWQSDLLSLPITKIYYEGSADELTAIGYNQTYFPNATVYYYEESDPSGKAGNFWHGDVSNPIEW